MYKKFIKRPFDLLFSLTALLLLSPVLVIVGILVKATSQGPVFFRQERAGKNGKYFRIFKFRSMAVDPDAEKKGFEPGSKMRVTPLGRILRKTKLDEFPQFFNVIKGEMSIVGPRPEVRKYVEAYPERWAKVLSISPGITDPGSIEFRNEEDILSASSAPEREYIENLLPQKLDLYEKYAQSISFLSDIRIIVRTMAAVVFK
ncbi:MAG: hypothetical protein A2020_04595 [Lentisphaerae bacterium GWF2_45_14]|nr:MAG: hypothetical protein A2020_04595 [Lentisphaerae bacterium GWF2_45_14]